MKIVNMKKFIRTISILAILLIICTIFTNKTYSNTKVSYKEEIISSGDTLWTICKNEQNNNKYFQNEDIRNIIEEIKQLNKLENSNLYEGQKIIIPIYM